MSPILNTKGNSSRTQSLAALHPYWTPRTLSPSKKSQRNYRWTSSKYTSVFTTIVKVLTLAAMDSAMMKWNFACSSMDLTKLRELKGYPCGRFS
jgi:hypothetical protein